jgi:hypothetical protein
MIGLRQRRSFDALIWTLTPVSLSQDGMVSGAKNSDQMKRLRTFFSSFFPPAWLFLGPESGLPQPTKGFARGVAERMVLVTEELSLGYTESRSFVRWAGSG